MGRERSRAATSHPAAQSWCWLLDSPPPLLAACPLTKPPARPNQQQDKHRNALMGAMASTNSCPHCLTWCNEAKVSFRGYLWQFFFLIKVLKKKEEEIEKENPFTQTSEINKGGKNLHLNSKSYLMCRGMKMFFTAFFQCDLMHPANGVRPKHQVFYGTQTERKHTQLKKMGLVNI